MFALKTKMDRRSSDDTGALISNMTHDCVAFSDIETVANGWMIDFYFSSACRFFKGDKQEEFNKSMRSLEAIIQGTGKMKLDQEPKMQLCGFLARVMNGKRLGLLFDRDKQLMPLVSALSVWNSFRDSVVDKALFETIQKILFIQAAGVCLEQGCYDRALAVLEQMVEEYQMPEELQMKLSAIVKRKDVYHQCFVQFSFTHLVESIKTFLDSFLQAHPSDFLLKAASKVVLTCGVEEYTEGPHTSGLTAQCEEDSRKNHGAPTSSALASSGTSRHGRRLLPMQSSPWKPESGKKLDGGIKRFRCNSTRVSARMSTQQNKDPNILGSTENDGRKKKMKWTFQEDCNLKTGVRHHGEGKWSQILQDFDFSGRTGVMLKDRWRTLKKLGKVG